MVEIWIPTAFFCSITAIIVGLSYIRNRRVERTALIAAGLDASIFNTESEQGRKYSPLKYGLLAIGIALGIIAGDLLYKSNVMTAEVAYLSMVFMFGGASLIVFYFIYNKKNSYA